MVTQNSINRSLEEAVVQFSGFINKQKKKILKTWTGDKEEFFLQCDGGIGEWYITNDDRLLDRTMHDSEFSKRRPCGVGAAKLRIGAHNDRG